MREEEATKRGREEGREKKGERMERRERGRERGRRDEDREEEEAAEVRKTERRKELEPTARYLRHWNSVQHSRQGEFRLDVLYLAYLANVQYLTQARCEGVEVPVPGLHKHFTGGI